MSTTYFTGAKHISSYPYNNFISGKQVYVTNLQLYKLFQLLLAPIFVFFYKALYGSLFKQLIYCAPKGAKKQGLQLLLTK